MIHQPINILNTSHNTNNLDNSNNSDNLNKLTDLSHLLYDPGILISPFDEKYNKIIFADDTASGRPCRLVESYMTEKIYPYYSNTHSNASCGIMMKNLVARTRDIIKTTMKLRPDHKIIFSGNGTTGAVNHLVNKIDFTKHDKVNIHISSYEHHSNFLPWEEAIKKYSNSDNIKLDYIDTNNNFDILVDEYIKKFDNELKTDTSKSRLDIFSLTACSNVTGKRYDLTYTNLINYIDTKKKEGYNIYILLDYACSAPYVDIDMSNLDGIYFSGHKFLGGQGTPGVLIINENLIEINHPYEPGGGCVEKADDKCVIYKSDVEMREAGGTPNIAGIIRLGYVLMIKKSIIHDIENNEHILSEYINNKMHELQQKYTNFKVIGLHTKNNNDLPIYPVSIDGLHYNLITVLFNDLLGIQTRGGISCCGTFGRLCNEHYGINGWCRISFNYLHKKEDINNILKTLEYIIQNGHKYINQYDYDKDKNLFIFKSF